MTTFRKLERTDDLAKPPRVEWSVTSREANSWRSGMLPLISGVPLQGDVRNDEVRRAIPAWKRALDLGLIFLSLPVLLPLFLLIALWVRLSSAGPVFFRQTRIGLRGKAFTIYKFRSMTVRADTASHEAHVEELVKSDLPMTKLDTIGDTRMVLGGRLLRVTAMDELPQLINVVRGEMSLVGPRPCLPSEWNLYSTAQHERFEALPGLTGYWQVNGKNDTTFSQMVEMDIHYARKKSLWLDLAILARTPVVIFVQTFGAGMRYARSKVKNFP